MISRASRFITLVVYDRERNTKCFSLDKQALKLMGVAVPLVFFITLGFFLFMSVRFKTIMGEIRGQAPEELVRLREENQSLSTQIKEIQTTNQEFENKLTSMANTSAIPVDGHPYSQVGSLLAPIQGAQDLRSQKIIDIEGTQTVIDSSKVVLKFNILNQETQEKVQGHVLVFMRDNQGIQIYPEANAINSSNLTQFNRGEKFTVARFRPVEATFSRPPLKSKSLFFKIALLNRTGDILVFKDYGPVDNR